MIRIEKTDVFGWESAIRGMRNPLNSWSRSDSKFDGYGEADGFSVGEDDLDLMLRLADAGAVHAKYRRMIVVTMDVTAPLYWWKEYDTYKVGTVANSCSTMHKIHARPLTLEDFSTEHLTEANKVVLEDVIHRINVARDKYMETRDKDEWWQMIQMLPSSYNQKRTLMLNYEVLAGIYRDRKNHKLDEWHAFCEWIEGLPYSAIITGVRG